MPRDSSDNIFVLNLKINIMKKFLVERKPPGAGNMTAEELKAISKTAVEVMSGLGKPYRSFI